MSEFTSTRQDFERHIRWRFIGPPEDAWLFVQGIATPAFYHVSNGVRAEFDQYVELVAFMRARTSDFYPVVEDFLRDGDRLAARVTGTMKFDGVDSEWESFMFAKIEEQGGKMEWLHERFIKSPIGFRAAFGEPLRSDQAPQVEQSIGGPVVAQSEHLTNGVNGVS